MTILISGATGGIGQAVCTHLVDRGETLVITSRDSNKLAAAQLNYKTQYETIITCHSGDFSHAPSVQSLCSELKDSAYVFDGVVLIYPGIEKPSEAFPSAEVWTRNWSTCFVQPLELLRCAAGMMAPGGKIVVVSGIASSQVFPQLSLSNAIRSAWLAQAKTLSFALGRSGLCINTVSLGCILTDRIKGKLAVTEQRVDPMSVMLQEHKVSALGHHAEPAQAAATICGMLTSFADHVTGTNIVCDGGYTRHYS